MNTGFSRIKSSFKCWKLTGYPAGRLVPNEAEYFVNGNRIRMRGSHLLGMVMNIITDDEYGLKGIGNLNCVVDIGSNIGVFAVHAATRFPGVLLHCYEPDPRNEEDLRFNTATIQATCYAEAVSDVCGYVRFSCEPNTVSSRISRDNRGQTQEKVINVESVNLQKVIDRLGCSGVGSLLKLDCEGAEYEILLQDSVTFFENIVGEFHSTGANSPGDAVDRLRDLGYKIKEFRTYADDKAIVVANK
jgi:FkbM family methyltransferase